MLVRAIMGADPKFECIANGVAGGFEGGGVIDPESAADMMVDYK